MNKQLTLIPVLETDEEMCLRDVLDAAEAEFTRLLKNARISITALKPGAERSSYAFQVADYEKRLAKRYEQVAHYTEVLSKINYLRTQGVGT